MLLLKVYNPVPVIQAINSAAPHEDGSDHEAEADLGQMIQVLALERDEVNFNFFPRLIPLTPDSLAKQNVISLEHQIGTKEREVT